LNKIISPAAKEDELTFAIVRHEVDPERPFDASFPAELT
jgi:hypothetical protein